MIALQADLFGKRYEYGHKAFKCGPFWIYQIIVSLIEGSVKKSITFQCLVIEICILKENNRDQHFKEGIYIHLMSCIIDLS